MHIHSKNDEEQEHSHKNVGKPTWISELGNNVISEKNALK